MSRKVVVSMYIDRSVHLRVMATARSLSVKGDRVSGSELYELGAQLVLLAIHGKIDVMRLPLEPTVKARLLELSKRARSIEAARRILANEPDALR